MIFSKVTIVGGTLLLAAATGAVAAAPDAKRPVVIKASVDAAVRHVSYGDLNLASLADQKTLSLRVANAASDVCYVLNDLTRHLNILSACRREAMRGARPQIAEAVVRAQQIASTGQSLVAVNAITLTFAK